MTWLSPNLRTKRCRQSWEPTAGQIGEGLTRYLRDHATEDVRVISRKPRKIHETDQVSPADLTDAGATADAVRGREIAYVEFADTTYRQGVPAFLG